MQALIDSAAGQFIDSSGKCRAVSWTGPDGGKVYGILPYPIHPLRAKRDLAIKPPSLQSVLTWAAGKSLVPKAQTISRGKTTVIHLSPEKYHSLFPVIYVPVAPTTPAPKLPEAPFNNQLHSSEPSLTQSYEEHHRIATVLKAYALFTYARLAAATPAPTAPTATPAPPTSPPSGRWGPDAFVVLPASNIQDWADTLTSGEGNHNALTADNPHIYDSEGRIKVPSEDIRRRLLEYVYVQTVKNPAGVSKVPSLSLVPGSYETIGDFTPRGGQVIFTNREGLVKWCRNVATNRYRAHTLITPELMSGYTPFFLRDPTIQPNYPHLVMLQPVINHEKARAAGASMFWVSAHKNSLSSLEFTMYQVPAASKKIVDATIVVRQGDRNVYDPTKPTVLEVDGDKYLAVMHLKSRP